MESHPDIILASASPRRAELLTQIGVRYHQQSADIDEQIGVEETPEQAVVRLAIEKAVAVRGHSPLGKVPVLGADTIVVDDAEILQKPSSKEEGVAMLGQLSGSTHQVMSAVAVVTGDRAESALNISQVTFRQTTDAEREAYWESGEPADKAGGYGIQGLGAIFISNLEGSYSGVMGLPLFETTKLLQQAGVTVL